MTARRQVALATYAREPQLTPDDALLVPAFARLGVGTRAVPWDDPGTDWMAFDAVLVRSTWDYHLKLPRFLEWTSRLEGLGVSLVNSAPLIRWNARKDYLKELTDAGVDVIPTSWVRRGGGRSLQTMLEAAGWSEAVVKPVVSASAHETWRTSLEAAAGDQERFGRLVLEGDVMVQPFLREIESAGEWSLVFLGDRFSHAVVKRPKADDFRVQKQFGGSRELVEPEPWLIAAARVALDAAPGRSLYSRVDGCVVNGRFLLMELELIEPELFLGSMAAAAGALAAAVLGYRAPGEEPARDGGASVER
jgi:hypothetical protein